MLFLFHIVDEGLIQRVVARTELSSLKELIAGEIAGYLDKHGFEGTTEDGYAKIVSVDPLGVQEEEHLWSYSFDGEESIEAAVDRIIVPAAQSDDGQDFREVNVRYRVDGLVTVRVRAQEEAEALEEAETMFWESHDGKLINELEGHLNSDISVEAPE